MSCKIGMGCRYSINGYVFPQPVSTSWERVAAGQFLSSGLPLYSPYRRHTWRFTALPNDPYTQRLEALEGIELTSLVTDSPSEADEFSLYEEAKILSVAKTHSWGAPRGIEVVFEVFAPR